MRSILFFICLIFTFEGQAQEVEKSHMWKVELSGALNNNSAWEVEPSVTYLPIPYVGITMGLLFCNTIEKDSYTGFSRDNQWFWNSDESNPGCHFFALRPAIQLVTPAFKFGKDKDTGLSLVVSPGLTIPLPVNQEFNISYVPNTPGIWIPQKFDHIKNKCMTGRVNPDTGRSYKYFTSSEQSLREVLEERVGLRVLLENDTRARCYAEYTCGKSKDESNVLYLHMGRGVAIGIVVDGQLYYGKSGFAGEFGHIPFFDNEIICSCGKKGCLETEVSGIAIEDKMCHLIEKGVNTILKEKYDQQKSIHIDDIIAAAKNDDNLSIELIEEAGEKVGKAVAFLINTFNPETVIVGGNMRCEWIGSGGKI